MKFPDRFDVPDNIVQQIQISHNFIESYITIEEKNWNSISYYNESREIIIVLVLDEYNVSSDFTAVLDEFKKELEEELSEAELKKHLERIYNLSLTVFRTRDEVIGKLSNQVAQLKTMEYDLRRRFEKIAKADHLKVKSKIQFLLAVNNEMKYKELHKSIDTSKNWLDKVIATLTKNNIIGYNDTNDTYYLII